MKILPELYIIRMCDPKNGPRIDAEILEVVNHLRESGISRFFIAGGCFRDSENRIPVKDIDVFIPGVMPEDADPDPGLRYDLDMVDIVHVGKTEVNLIGMKRDFTFQEILARMDIGLCQIGLDGGFVKATKAYLDDVKNKTITVFFEPTSAHDYAHIERVQAKYPDHTVVNAWEQ